MAHRSDSMPSWWNPSVEDTLMWPSLRPYNLSQVPLISLLDVPFEAEASALHDNHACSSLHLSPHVREAYMASSQGGLDDPTEMKQLVDWFMKSIHTKQPVIDPDVLYKQIAVVQENGLSWDGPTCLLLIACALGAICTPYSHSTLEDYSSPSIDSHRYLRSREYFDAGRRRLGLTMEHASITGVQCFFFAAGYYITTFNPFAAWRTMNAASVMCKNVMMISHEDSGGGSEFESSDSNEARDNSRRKLFWSCLKTEREMATELGFDIANLHLIEYKTPTTMLHDPNLQVPHINVDMPSPQPFTPNPTALGRLRIEEQEQSWFYYLTDISLRKLEIQIDSFFRSKQQQPSPMSEAYEVFYRDILVTLADSDQQIVDHFKRLPAPISVETDDSGHSPDDLREYLRLRMIRIRHDLSRPALYLILHGVFDDISAHMRAQAVQIANRALAIDEYLVTHGLTTHRHPGTWLGVRYCTRAALELFAAAKAGSPDIILPRNWRAGMERFKVALRYWSAESRDALLYLGWIERLES
ncbi:hypothetical protein LTR84_010551 [Exophiala bonariae]|uniref:Xylanolytic transcriptional activator regulatory domain-containing protein n=1 Tax=Exophiala bonariae TaxID=1690606 RepID=A0AAV9MT28_9EURO|nr:hypothetical protein LTR84_010551 [Exophiala bonariae]